MTGYARGDADFASAELERFRRDARAPKDYSVPLHVDCSIEYELPDCAKPPRGVEIEPLLMIHPAHFRRLESLRRVPFVNNLPREETPAAAAAADGGERRSRPAVGGATASARRCCRAGPAPPRPAPALPAPTRREPSVPKRRAHPYLPMAYERFDARALQPLPLPIFL